MMISRRKNQKEECTNIFEFPVLNKVSAVGPRVGQASVPRPLAFALEGSSQVASLSRAVFEALGVRGRVEHALATYFSGPTRQRHVPLLRSTNYIAVHPSNSRATAGGVDVVPATTIDDFVARHNISRVWGPSFAWPVATPLTHH